MCSLFSVFILFYLILENMSNNVGKLVFLVIIDTCDVMYHWSISLLPPIVLGNLFVLMQLLRFRFSTRWKIVKATFYKFFRFFKVLGQTVDDNKVVPVMYVLITDLESSGVLSQLNSLGIQTSFLNSSVYNFRYYNV